MTQESLTRPPLVGESARTHQLLRLIEKVGQSRWPVLILGETGTGKELVARAVHNENPQGPFVTIDCSALAGSIIESELFGHTKGAFTGALAQKIGLIEAAHGGTAFFDEIGELPLDFQAKLLRVLQEKEFRPLGAVHNRRSEFRVIAATNRDLAKEVERGTFRRDLYYRLNVVSIKLSPLRERREDIPVLAKHFINLYGNGHVLTREALDALLSHEWPGNVRELEHCIQHMVALYTGPLLGITSLPSAIQNYVTARKGVGLAMAAGARSYAVAPVCAGLPAPTLLPTTPGPIPIVPLEEVERREIIKALDYTKGDRGLAASLLGIGRTTLYRKLKYYQLAS